MSTFLIIIDAVIYVAIAFAIVEVYLKVNKIWKRKHEKEVAASQSLYGLALSLFILVAWSVKYLVSGDYTSIADNAVYLIETTAMILVGSGFFVKSSKGKGFITLVKQALKIERKEATYLINTISGKAEALEIVNILHQLAWIDDELEDKEKLLISDFAKYWNIDYSPNNKNLKPVPKRFTEKLKLIRSEVEEYIDSHPDKEQTAQVIDLMENLIKADDKTTDEEQIIFDEVNAMLNNYLADGDELTFFHVLIVPQESSHSALIRQLNPKAKELHTAGGVAFSIEKYLSEGFAESMCERYRKEGLFTIVYKEESNKTDAGEVI